MAWRDDPDNMKECMNNAYCCICPAKKMCDDYIDDSEEYVDDMVHEFKEELL